MELWGKKIIQKEPKDLKKVNDKNKNSLVATGFVKPNVVQLKKIRTKGNELSLNTGKIKFMKKLQILISQILEDNEDADFLKSKPFFAT